MVPKNMPWMDQATVTQEAEARLYAAAMKINVQEFGRVFFLLGAEPWTTEVEVNKIGIPLQIRL